MPTNITPTLQTRVNDPYQQRLFDFGTSDSRLYLARVSNQLLRTYGDDIILKGFEIDSISSSGSVVTVNITGGLAIIDHTLVQIDDTILTVDIDVAPYEATGKIIVHLNYQFLQTVEENPVRMKASYIDDAGSSVSPDGWNWNKDRIIIAIFGFEKNPSNNITNFFEITDVVKSTNILSQTYYKQGYNPSENQSMDTYFNYSNIVNTKLIVSDSDQDKKPLYDKVSTNDSSIVTSIDTPIPNSETLNLALKNDQTSPGDNYMYSTDKTGEKGWQPSPFSDEFSILTKRFIDETMMIFSPSGAITYDSRGNISTIQSTMANGETLNLVHSYNTRDDLTNVVATSNSQSLWLKTYSYNSDGDVSGWQVTIF